MHRVTSRLDENIASYRDAKFLQFLRDPQIDPERKLKFAPHVAHFVLTFGDLCSLLLPEEKTNDPWQELVNANCAEDVGHWKWYLADLAALNLDSQIPYSDAIRTIWSDRTVATRLLSYNLVHIALAEDSIGRLVLVHCVEGAFKATLGDLHPVSNAYVKKTGKPLHYMGTRHAEAEDHQTMGQSQVQQRIREIEINTTRAEELCVMVDKCFDLFRAFSDEMLALVEGPAFVRAASAQG
jgi:hypothetical protein